MGKVVKKLDKAVLHGRVCGNCRLFERFPDSGQHAGEDILGECCLHPPTVHGYADQDGGNPIQSRPMVYFHERCGQHQPQVN